jgi:hypothetical protein
VSLGSILKAAGKTVGLDYAAAAARNTLRLREFSARFGVAPVYFPKKCVDSDMPIDVVIPVVDKDAETLSYVVDSVREYLRHPVTGVYLVCPGDSVATRKIASEKNCVFVDERELVPISPKDINYIWRGHNRAGWVYQQFLKWSGGRFCAQRHYLVADSDTVLARPQSFEFEGKIIFDFCDEFHSPYFRAFERIFGISPKSTLSFTSHHALIDTEVVGRIESEIEARHGMPWYRAIIEAIDQAEMSCVSDYDNYGQYILETMPQAMRVRYWYNKSLPRKEIKNLDAWKRRYGSLYSTLSFHSYKS